MCLAYLSSCILAAVINSEAFKDGPMIVLEITVSFPIFGNSTLMRTTCVCVYVMERTRVRERQRWLTDPWF